MKDKLRELAEMVRDAYRAGFIAACKWPSPVSQDVDSSAYNKEFNAWSFSVREKHAAILNAEGDGGAVEDNAQCSHCGAIFTRRDWTADNFDRPIPRCQFCGSSGAPQPVRTTETHPARSGVVRDEDVRDAARYRWLREHATDGFMGTRLGSLNCDELASEWDAWIDAAIQGERHE